MWRRAECDGATSKRLRNGNTRHYFYDGMALAHIDVNEKGENVDGTFNVGSAPALALMKKINAEAK